MKWRQPGVVLSETLVALLLATLFITTAAVVVQIEEQALARTTVRYQEERERWESTDAKWRASS